MSAINSGDQILTFDFRQDATSTNFNRYNSNIVKPGIYKGGRVYFERFLQGNSQFFRYVIDNFTAAFLVPESTSISDVSKKLLVNVTTNSQSTFSSTLPSNIGNTVLGIPSLNNSLYLVMTLDWVKSINNYLNFYVISDISSLPSNGLILCRLYGNGTGNKPDIYYDATSYGSFYESYDDKFTNYNNGDKAITSNYGGFFPPTSDDYPKRLIPFSSNFYYLEFTTYNSNPKFHYVSFQPFNGQIELINTDNYKEKIKFTFDISGNINVELSAKVKLVNNSTRVTDSMSFYVDSYKRLNIFNGYSATRKYMIKTDIFNNSRILNTFTSQF